MVLNILMWSRINKLFLWSLGLKRTITPPYNGVLKLIVLSYKENVKPHSFLLFISLLLTHSMHIHKTQTHTGAQKDTVINTYWYIHTSLYIIHTYIYIWSHISMYTQILQMYTDAHKYKQKHTYRCENTQRYRHMNSPISPPVSLPAHTREFKNNECVDQKHES